jgi:hypothetical protein
MKHFAFAMLVAMGLSALAACDQQKPATDLFAVQRTFDTADSNKDGVVSQHEAISVVNLDFAAADTDRNAALSPEEFQVAMASARPPGG